MNYRLSNLRVPVEDQETPLEQHVRSRTDLSADAVRRIRILRRSLDARRRDRLEFVYTLLLDVPESAGPLPQASRPLRLEPFEEPPFQEPPDGSQPMRHRPVIVGAGPAGLLAGYYLASRGYRPLIIERGQPVRDRVRAVRAFDSGGPHDEENNYLFGEGGAGCFSDGKLTCRVSGADVDRVLEIFVDCGGRSSLVWEQRPHLGSNKLPLICRNFRRRIEALGGEYRFGCRLDGFRFADGQLKELLTSSGPVSADVCVLAIGHSARDTYDMLVASGLPLRPKAFQLGLRIEHPQELVNRHKYGRSQYLDLLGAADYSLVARGQRDVFTFCMCAGGVVIPGVSEPRMFCSNGMSNSRHDTPFANSGVVATLQPSEFGSHGPLSGVRLQQHFESIAFHLGRGDYLAPVQRATDFLADRSEVASAGSIPSSYKRGVVTAPLSSVLPARICQALRRGLPVMDRQWGGGYLRDAVLVGPEMRGSSPVRIDRSRDSWQIPDRPGVYPVGEGAGYAGGIVTAAVDGLRAAKQIVARYAAPTDA